MRKHARPHNGIQKTHPLPKLHLPRNPVKEQGDFDSVSEHHRLSPKLLCITLCCNVCHQRVQTPNPPLVTAPRLYSGFVASHSCQRRPVTHIRSSSVGIYITVSAKKTINYDGQTAVKIPRSMRPTGVHSPGGSAGKAEVVGTADGLKAKTTQPRQRASLVRYRGRLPDDSSRTHPRG